MSEDDTFFGDEDGEAYWGFGHLPAGEFVAKVNADAVMTDPDGFEDVSPSQVQHLWAVWTDDEPHESFRVVVSTTPGVWPITRCAYDGYLLTVQSNRPQPQTRRDKRIAALEAELKHAARSHTEMMEEATTQRLRAEQAEAELATTKAMVSEKARFEYGFQCGALEQELATAKETIEALEELVEELDPHHLKRNKMGIRARAEAEQEEGA